MKHFILLLTAACIPAMAGCTSYRVNAEEIAFKSTIPQENLNRIQYLETVNVPYEVIGTVIVRTERRNNIDEVVDKMKRQIAVLGGDAVTNIVQVDNPGPFTSIRTTYKGTVIVFKNDNSAASDGAGDPSPESVPMSQGENLK